MAERSVGQMYSRVCKRLIRLVLHGHYRARAYNTVFVCPFRPVVTESLCRLAHKKPLRAAHPCDVSYWTTLAAPQSELRISHPPLTSQQSARLSFSALSAADLRARLGEAGAHQPSSLSLSQTIHGVNCAPKRRYRVELRNNLFAY